MQITFCQRAEKTSEMVRLLEFSYADLDDVAQVLTDLFEQLEANLAFSRKESVKWVLVLACLTRQSSEVLPTLVSHGSS